MIKQIKKILNDKLFILSFFSISCFILLSFTNTSLNDFWWHTKVGEYIVENNTIPFIDVFSWSGVMEGLYWFSHEWLSEIVIYITSLLGKVGVLGFVAFTAVSLFVFLIFTNKKNIKENYVFAFIWIGTGLLLFNLFLSPRPHMISFILLAITIWLLYKYYYNENFKLIWGLPFVSLLWANFHGGSSNLPYILCLIFLIVGLFNFNAGKLEGKRLTSKQIKTIFIVMILCFLSLILNPHGFSLISYPYSNMNDTTMLYLIGEWRSPDLKKLKDIIYLLPILIPTLLFITTKANIKFIDLILFGAFSYLTLKSIRFSALLYIVDSYMVFNYADIFTVKKVYKDINLDILLTDAFKILTKVLTVIVLISFISFTVICNSIDLVFTPILSDTIIETLKEESPKRLFNEYDFGGYLIYKDIQPFIDGRADMYSGEILDSYYTMSYFLSPTLEEKYNFDYYLIYKNRDLDNYFSRFPERYIRILEENNIVLYKDINKK